VNLLRILLPSSPILVIASFPRTREDGRCKGVWEAREV
jgi:hypothetical protein